MTAPAADPWTPMSPCGPSCLPRSTGLSQVGRWRRTRRLAAGTVMLLLGGPLVSLGPLLGTRACRWCTRHWFLGVLRAFGVRLVVRGSAVPVPGGPGTLVVSNHASWLDVVALQALCPMRMLAKAEMRDWPLLGVLAARAGTLFIRRGSLAGLRNAVDRIGQALGTGSVVGAFPEGTTWCGRASGRHRPAVFQAALDARARVQPAALVFRTSAGHRTTAAAFVGDATLLQSVGQVARTRGLVVEVNLLPVVEAVGDRRELACRCESAIKAVTEPVDTGWTSTPVEVAGSSGDHEEYRRDGRPGQQSRTQQFGGRRQQPTGQRAVESGAA